MQIGTMRSGASPCQGGTASPMPLLFALTALAEIVGCYLPWLVVKGAACGCWRLPLCRLACLPDC